MIVNIMLDKGLEPPGQDGQRLGFLLYPTNLVYFNSHATQVRGD